MPLLDGNATQEAYEEALELAEYLVEHDINNPAFELVCKKIRDYEDNHPDYAAINAELEALPASVAALTMLTEKHNLNQSSFTEEIGSRSLVSKIIKGQRNLTIEQIRKLSARFNVPVSIFI